MRKLKLQVQISVDGYIGGPNGELDWMTWNWDDKLKDYVNKLHENIDTIILGKNMTEGFVSHWAKVAVDPNDPSHEFGKLMNDTPKVVFSKTLKESQWENTVVATGDLTEEINNLKKKAGGDMIVYGGATMDGSLIGAGLIDEMHFFVNPTMIGKGLPIFDKVENRQNLELIHATPFECGIVVLCYKHREG